MARRIINVMERFHLSYGYTSSGRMIVIFHKGKDLWVQKVGLYPYGGLGDS